MTIEEIRAAIVASTELRALLPDTQAIADALSVGRVKTRFFLATERTAVATLGVVAGEQFLSALEAFAVASLAPDHPLIAYQPGIARQLGWLKRDGLDVGSPSTRQVLDALASLGTLDASSVAAIKALGEVPDPVSEMDVRKAVWNDNGTEAV